MTENNGLELSRRKALAGIGAIGVASAGAGLGTSAYFSDTESFDENTITAGELDLKVDWEEHYFGGRNENGSSEATVVPGYPNPADVDYYLPAMSNTDADPIALNFETDQDALWDATAIEAFPDTGDAPGDTADDGIRDAEVTCSDLESVDAALDSRFRTSGNGQGGDGDPDPLVQLGDVKPGDFGEVTFSLHLCDNPGYLWMQGEFVGAAENGITEPEGDDPQEDGDDVTVDSMEDGDYGKVELVDEVRTRMWYDENCDNQIETGTVDVMIAVDKSISQEVDDQNALVNGLNEFVSGLSSSSQVGLLRFGGGSVDSFQGLGTPGNLDLSAIDPSSGSGNTPLPPALDIAHQELDTNGTNDEQVIVAFTDGGPNYFNDTYSAGGYSSGGGNGLAGTYTGGGGGNDAQGRTGGISDSELIETAEVAEAIRDAGTRIITVDVEVPDGSTDPHVNTSAYLRNEIASSQAYAKDILLDNLAAVANDLAAVSMNEDLFFEGSLREALETLSSGKGIPLDGDPTSSFNEFSGTIPDIDGDGDDELTAGGPTDEDRNDFAAETTHCVGFEWWLPLNHANQVQGDSVEFNVGFYTEQSRHNDGNGQSA